MCAANGGRADCARLRIDAGADKDAKNNVRVNRCIAALGHLVFSIVVVLMFSFRLLAYA